MIKFGDLVEINCDFPFENTHYKNGSKCLVIEVDKTDPELPYCLLKEGQKETVWASENDIFKITKGENDEKHTR